ncbi:hypothetical protein AB0J83_10530 [Actinoplanes sp. NPDC049596]|uniref:hypothetical protein n=1 Tax=unclassified Actinoplanes TaxID=2626549 RepID=UPI003428772D
MATVEIEGGDLVVRVEGMDKLWALKSSLTIPLANVRGATNDPGMVSEPKGVRTAGTYVPGVVVAGSFRRDGERVFWDVRDPAKAVVIELADEQYARLVVQVDDPRATVELVEQAAGTRKD